MTEPLDFTNVGRNKVNAPPQEQRAAPPPQRKSTKFDPWWKSKKVIVPVALVAILIAVSLFVRSRENTGSEVSAFDTATYCQLSLQFELLGSSTGAAPTSATAFDGPPPAIAEFVKQSRPIVSQMESLASSEVRSDLKTEFAALEKAAEGDRSGVDSPSFATAQQRLVADRGVNCPVAVESGEG